MAISAILKIPVRYRSDAHIHKINDSSFVKNAIYQISSASSQNEYKGDGCDQVDN